MQPVPHLLWVLTTTTTLPLIVFLHGAGESGTNPTSILSVGATGTLPDLVAKDGKFKMRRRFALLSPQTDDGWCTASSIEAVLGLIRATLQKVPSLDPQRIYLTGVSMGGNGVWCLASHQPKLFAAIVPVCGYSHEPRSDILPLATSHVPIWIAHGANDVVVSVSHSDAMASLCHDTPGCNLYMYSRYPVASTPTGFTLAQSGGHAAWKELYGNATFWEWLLGQKIYS